MNNDIDNAASRSESNSRNSNREARVAEQRIDSATLSSLRYQIDTRGYGILQGFINHRLIETLKSAMVSAIATYKPRKGVAQSVNDQYLIHDLMVRDENYRQLLDDGRLQQILEVYLGEHWIMYAATSSSIPPNSKNYSSRIHVDSPRFLQGYVFNMGVIWALDDYTEDNGALEVLPGSCHSGEIPDANLFERCCVKVLCAAGALIVFNARLFHRTAVNYSSSWRHAMTLNACRSFMKPRMDWPRMIPTEVVGSLRPQVRRVLGFDTRIPSSLDEFFLPEAERLYKPGQG